MSNRKTVVVVGLGYVGLPLALLADEKKYKVYGIDIDTGKINSLNKNVSYIGDVTNEELEKSNAIFSESFGYISEADAVIICVPTPVTFDKQPDLGPVISSIKLVAPHLKDSTLVVIESTVNPGVCDDIVVPLLQEITGKRIGKDIFLAHCPERVNPGDPKWNVRNINRVVGANSKTELNSAVELYENLIDADIKPMGSLKEAEAVKVVENSFRDINIAFVNELAMSFHKLGINIENVIDGAATKPFAFMPHRPGTGVGGHCIPVDPYYLIEYAHDAGFEHDFLRLARSINESMPEFTVNLLSEGLNELEKPLKGSTIALLGLSYKPNVGDDRESPSYDVKKHLMDRGAKLNVFDPYLIEKSSVATFEDALRGADAVVICTGHSLFKEKLTANMLHKHHINLVIDGRNILKDHIRELRDSSIIYYGIGI